MIPEASAIECLNALHDSICDGDSNVYVHCVAGWNRSPTILWLYLVSCGIASDTAADMITSASFDAVPAHSKLINCALVNRMRDYGVSRFQPHPRPDSIESPKAA